MKLRWLLDNVDEVQQAVQSERAMFGTVDSWIIWVRAAQRAVDPTLDEKNKSYLAALNKLY